MSGHADDREVSQRRRLSAEEFRTVRAEAGAEARRLFLGRPPREKPAFALLTQHAEFGAAAH